MNFVLTFECPYNYKFLYSLERLEISGYYLHLTMSL